MKPKDFAVVGVAVVLGIILSIIVSNMVFGSGSAHNQQIEIVPSISATLPKPDSQYFNANSLDPTQFISIGNSQNPNPFGVSTGQN